MNVATGLRKVLLITLLSTLLLPYPWQTSLMISHPEIGDLVPEFSAPPEGVLLPVNRTGCIACRQLLETVFGIKCVDS